MVKISDLKNKIIKTLDSNKASNIVEINLNGKSSIADYMIIASGTSSRHLQALSEILVAELKKIGLDENYKIEIINSTNKEKREKYVKHLYKKLQRERENAFQEFYNDVQNGAFPEKKNIVEIAEDELDKFLNNLEKR
mgnify:CR=1 FL=1